MQNGPSWRLINMFILSNADGIVYKNDNAFIIRFDVDNAAGGTPVFFGGDSDSSFDSLGSNLSAATELDRIDKTSSFAGALSFRERNTYGQTQYEGAVGESDKAVIVALGSQVDMSDSQLLFVNMEPAEAWKLLLALSESHIKELKDKASIKKMNEVLAYVQSKNGIEPAAKKKGLFSHWFSA